MSGKRPGLFLLCLLAGCGRAQEAADASEAPGPDVSISPTAPGPLATSSLALWSGPGPQASRAGASDTTLAATSSPALDPAATNCKGGICMPECSQYVLDRRAYVAANNLTQFGVNAQVTFGETLLIFVIIFLFAMVVAGIYNGIQATLYNKDKSLDASFDAGGNMGSGITASTLVSQWTWAATLLQSTGVGASYGISGPYWYASGATIQILLMAIMSYYLKLHAPGAKTFFQVIKSRYGTTTHMVVLVFGLFTNIIVTLSLLLGGTAVLTGLVQGLSPEFASMLLVVLIGGYTLVGGLGATFYVSYFNCFVIFGLIVVFTVEIFYNPFNNEKNPFGSAAKIYEFVNCWPGPDGNQDNSLLSFYSSGGLVFGIVNIVGNFGAVFADQSYWQSAVATKPAKAVMGFLAGGLTWFAVPFGLATTMSLGYHGLCSAQGSDLLTKSEISRGLVVPLVSEVLLGKLGGYATLVMMLMAVMSTGSAEIIAVGSIIIYDIYIPYMKPFRKDHRPGTCLLCTKRLRARVEKDDVCACPSMAACSNCRKDDEAREVVKGLVKPIYRCPIHAEYRDYQAAMVEFKDWAIIYCTLAIIPVLWPAVIFGEQIGLDLGWIYLFTGVLVASCVVPVALSLTWTRNTGMGVSCGVVGGAICSLTAWLIHASTYPDGLSDFIANTGRSLPMLTGNVVALVAGGVICCIVSFLTSDKETNAEEVWEVTRDIDNPLTPWTMLYQDDLSLPDPKTHHERPPVTMVAEHFKGPKKMAYIGAGGLTILMVFIWPLLMLEAVKFDETRFIIWTTVSQIWTFLAAAYIVVIPLYEEVREVFGQYKIHQEQTATQMPRSARSRAPSARARSRAEPPQSSPFDGELFSVDSPRRRTSPPTMAVASPSPLLEG